MFGKMKKGRGWIRILESFISLLIILFGLLFFVSHQSSTTAKEEKIREIMKTILEDLEKNYTLREEIKNNKTDLINESIRNFLSKYSYDFSFCITDPTTNCQNPGEQKQIYSDSILISYEEQGSIKSRKFVLFLWEK